MFLILFSASFYSKEETLFKNKTAKFLRFLSQKTIFAAYSCNKISAVNEK